MNRNDYIYIIEDDEGYFWGWTGTILTCLNSGDEDDMGARYFANSIERVKEILTRDNNYLSEEEFENALDDFDERYAGDGEYKDWFDPKETYLPDY